MAKLSNEIYRSALKEFSGLKSSELKALLDEASKELESSGAPKTVQNGWERIAQEEEAKKRRAALVIERPVDGRKSNTLVGRILDHEFGKDYSRGIFGDTRNQEDENYARSVGIANETMAEIEAKKNARHLALSVLYSRALDAEGVGPGYRPTGEVGRRSDALYRRQGGR